MWQQRSAIDAPVADLPRLSSEEGMFSTNYEIEIEMFNYDINNSESM